MIRFQIVQQKNGEWHPRVKAGNNETWFVAESSKRKATAKRRMIRFQQAFAVVIPLNPIEEVPLKKG